MKEVLESFDRYLGERKLTFHATVIGGTALIIMGVIHRATQDVDCLEPHLSGEMKKTSIDFARKYKKSGVSLKEDWLNNGPEDLMRDLPRGWEARRTPLFQGQNLFFKTLGRPDLLKSKLYAFCDRQQDLDDCIALRPSLQELKKSYLWLIDRDANPKWPEHVKKSLQELAKRLGDELET